MKMVTIGTKVSEDFRDEVAKEAQKSGKTTSDFLRLCVEEVVNGHYRLDGDRLVPTDEYLDVLRPMRLTVENTGFFDDSEEQIEESEFERLGFGGVLRMMRKKNYPDKAINQFMNQIRDQISENGNYSAKKVREDWC